VLEEFPLLFLTKLTVVLCMVLREGVHILGNFLEFENLNTKKGDSRTNANVIFWFVLGKKLKC
jgi:hypothetical protein